jgi:hypothetical protein
MGRYLMLLRHFVLLRMLRLDACVVAEQGSFGVAMSERVVRVGGMWKRIVLRSGTGC